MNAELLYEVLLTAGAEQDLDDLVGYVAVNDTPAKAVGHLHKRRHQHQGTQAPGAAGGVVHRHHLAKLLKAFSLWRFGPRIGPPLDVVKAYRFPSLAKQSDEFCRHESRLGNAHVQVALSGRLAVLKGVPRTPALDSGQVDPKRSPRAVQGASWAR